MGYRMVTLQPLLSSCKMCINVKSVGQGKIKFYAKIVRWFSLRKDLQTVLRCVCVCVTRCGGRKTLLKSERTQCSLSSELDMPVSLVVSRVFGYKRLVHLFIKAPQ